MLTVSQNSNPIIYNNYVEIKKKKTLIMFRNKMLTWQNQQGSHYSPEVLGQFLLTAQYTIAAINHQRANGIKCHDRSWPFCQSLKKLVVVERLFWQLGGRFSGSCRYREGAVSGGSNVFRWNQSHYWKRYPVIVSLPDCGSWMNHRSFSCGVWQG